MTALDGWEWRYLSGRRVVHALSYPSAAISRCGTGPLWFAPSDGWMGTGSQVEYETAAALPKCGRCTRLILGGTS